MDVTAISTKVLHAQDLPSVIAIEKKSYDHPWTFESFGQILSQKHFYGWGLFEQMILKGYAMYSVVLDEMNLVNLAIDPHSRAQGYGSYLLTHILHEASVMGAKQCFLEVRVDNKAALALYAKHGFTCKGRRVQYYSDGNDAFVMVRPLGE